MWRGVSAAVAAAKLRRTYRRESRVARVKPSMRLAVM